jgi:two-component system, OmpR family, sensor histidine kinase MprB
MSLRTRLTLVFVVTMTALVAATSIATYLVVRSSLEASARRSALSLAKSAASIEDPGETSLDRLAGPGTRVWLTDASGRVVAQSYSSGRPDTSAAEVDDTIAGAPGGSTSARWPRSQGGYAVVLLANSGIDSSLSTLLSTLLVVGAAVIAASAVLGALLAAGALRPLERMRRQADAIPGDELDRRLSVDSGDELGRLAVAFNRLLARAQRATEDQQRFVADASHELRTPVTALQGHARIAVRAAERGDLEQVRESAGIVSQESERLSRTLAELLSLAEAERSERPAEPVRLDEVVREACDELRVVHDGRLIEADLAAATVTGDAGRLGELVRIVIDNALKYSPAGQAVSVTVSAGSHPPVLRVRDHGPGLSDTDAEHAFDRFYRGAASRGVQGSGIGLAIAHAIAVRHAATLRLENAPGGGTIASVEFGGDAG